MASCLRVRAFSTASSALLKLKHHHRCYTNIQPRKLAGISRTPQFAFSPSFSRLFSTADGSASAISLSDEEVLINRSDSDECECLSLTDCECPSDKHSHSHESDTDSNGFGSRSRYSNGMMVYWHMDSKCYNIPYQNPFIREGSKNLYELKMEKEWIKVRMDMPGIDKKGVKATFSEGLLVLRGVEPEAAGSEGEFRREYVARVKFSNDESDSMKIKEATAEMNDGVLRVAIPRITLEEKKNTCYIPIK